MKYFKDEEIKNSLLCKRFLKNGMSLTIPKDDVRKSYAKRKAKEILEIYLKNENPEMLEFISVAMLEILIEDNYLIDRIKNNSDKEKQNTKPNNFKKKRRY